MKGASGNKPNYQSKHKLVGHDLGAVSVKFSPGGAWLASASADSTIRIWDPQSGKLIRTLKGHDKVEHLARLQSTAACQGTHQ
jgi:WD40 repeat protein